jgi:hypothetical protein
MKEPVVIYFNSPFFGTMVMRLKNLHDALQR